MTESRVVVAACVALLAIGLVVALRWRRCSFVTPPAVERLSVADALRRYVRLMALLLLSGIIAGITVIGAGGRLAMRLLAVTGGEEAQGRLTEAQEVVGEITVDGTIGFVLFVGVLGGVALSALYFVTRRCLPPGALGGAIFGLLLLVVAGTRVDPLDPGNPDFDIVGPGWLAVIVFVAQALLFGATLAAVAARLSAWLPLPSTSREVLARYVAPAAFAAFAFSITFVLAAGAVVVALVTRWSALVRFAGSPAAVVAGRVVLVAVALVAAPGAVAGVVEVAGS